MSELLKSIDQRTRLVGENRLELLTFHLNGSQRFAINVFKIQEVQTVPKLNSLPKSDPVVIGVTHVRGKTIPVIDLSLAIGRAPIRDLEKANIIVTEYNRSVQAFLVGGVDRIVNMNWDQILPPPKSSGRAHFLTAITQLDGKIVEIVDVERVLANVVDFDTDISAEVLDQSLREKARGLKVLLVDDSVVAIEQARATLEQLGLTVLVETDGLKALNRLQAMAADSRPLSDQLLMVVTDAEMPEMDGYRLTTEIRSDARMSDLFVVLHTSLSGSFNQAMVEKVGCDGFLSKFQPDKLAEVVQDRIRARLAE